MRAFEELAGELLDEVVESVCLGMPVGLSFGWCGIGWGVEYLVRKGFVEDDDNEGRNKIDEKVMEYDVRRLGDYSLATGLEGISWYVANSTIKAQNNAGGLVGSFSNSVKEGSQYFYNNYVHADIVSDNIETASLGFGNQKNEIVGAKNIYVYKYATINGERVSTENDKYYRNRSSSRWKS